MKSNGRIVLASASPRRSELLESARIPFIVSPADIPEEPFPGEAPSCHVLRLAEGKARAAAQREEGDFFIGADTIVVCDRLILGKPADGGEAAAMLRRLSGRSHEVVTGYAVLDAGSGAVCMESVTTRVHFKALSDEEISDYVATGCPMDKAGAYAIQGGAAYMVQRIEGSYTNVVGLPLCEVVETLRRLGAVTPEAPPAEAEVA